MKIRIIISAVMALTALSCATPSQLSADAEVNRLCKVDGGVKVYETVILPVDRFDKYGHVGLRNHLNSSPTDEYYFKSESIYLSKTDPFVTKNITSVIRRHDGKILGESIRYGRGGGDIPGPWHPSTFDCPEIRDAEGKLESSVFLNEGKKE